MTGKRNRTDYIITLDLVEEVEWKENLLKHHKFLSYKITDDTVNIFVMFKNRLTRNEIEKLFKDEVSCKLVKDYSKIQKYLDKEKYIFHGDYPQDYLEFKSKNIVDEFYPNLSDENVKSFEKLFSLLEIHFNFKIFTQKNYKGFCWNYYFEENMISDIPEYPKIGNDWTNTRRVIFSNLISQFYEKKTNRKVNYMLTTSEFLNGLSELPKALRIHEMNKNEVMVQIN